MNNHLGELSLLYDPSDIENVQLFSTCHIELLTIILIIYSRPCWGQLYQCMY